MYEGMPDAPPRGIAGPIEEAPFRWHVHPHVDLKSWMIGVEWSTYAIALRFGPFGLHFERYQD